jgi:hypothetical protein
MSHKQVIPMSATPKSQLKDDVIELAIANGFTVKDVERFEKLVSYRKQYSSRPEVVEKMKQYAKKRYEKMKRLQALLSEATAL